MKSQMNEYQYLAIDHVIDICREHGLKYRLSDFKDAHEQSEQELNNVLDYEDRIVISLWFTFSRLGKKLKKVVSVFLSYPECRVTSDGVFFTYTKNELVSSSSEGSSIKDIDEEKREGIIRKIRGLLAKADREHNDSEGEAIAASLMAQKMLQKYHLDMIDVMGEQDKGREIKNLSVDIGKGKDKKWKYELAETVAQNYCCKVYIVNSDSFVFVGYEGDALIARQMMYYLFNVGNTLANKYVRETRAKGLSASGVYESYCLGFCNGVRKALDENCKALMLVVQDDVQKKYAELTSTATTMNLRFCKSDVNAYNEGSIEGRRALHSRFIDG